MARQLVQLSDPHFVADATETPMSIPLRESLGHVVGEVQRESPNRVIVIGDLAQDGSPHADEALGEALAPLESLCYGRSDNHDDKSLLALHPSPVPVGAAWRDPTNLRVPEEPRRGVTAHPQVQLILFGNVHQAVDAQWDDVSLYGCPSTCFQFTPDEDTFALDPAPPGCRTVTLHEDGSLKTTVRRVPVPFTVDTSATGY